MAGPGRPRKRRVSGSSEITSYHAPVRYVKDTAVLRPVSPDVDSNSWPTYVLTDATVYRKDGRSIANPLMVHVEGPLVVRGNLEIDDSSLLPNLLRSNFRSGHIEITGSNLYAISDVPVALWLSGSCGWFEIKPSQKFKPMYDEVLEAVNLYYGVYMVYEDFKKQVKARKAAKAKKPSPPTLDEIFLKYAVRVGNGIVRDEVEALCHKWAEFLIAHFPKENDPDFPGWENTYFAFWLKTKHPDLVKRVSDAAKGILPELPPAEVIDSSSERAGRAERRRSRSLKAGSQSREICDVDMVDRPSAKLHALPTRLSSQAKPVYESPVPIPEKYLNPGVKSNSEVSSLAPRDSPPAESDSPVERLLSVINEIANSPTTDLSKSKASTVHNKIFFNCRIRVYAGTPEIIGYYAKDLLTRLDPKWQGTPFHEWLQKTVKEGPKPLIHNSEADIPAQTFRRGKRTITTTHGGLSSDLPPAISLGPRIKKAAAATPGDDASEDDQYSARARKSGKGAVLRPHQSSGKKRPGSVLEDYDEESGSRGRKSFKKTHHTHISDDDDEVSSSEEEDEAEELDLESRLPLPAGKTRVVITAERIPTMSPTGPNGTWTCDREGCDHVVRAAEDPQGQEQIQAHLQDHNVRAEKVDLALKESRGHMPISHLLAKIQDMGRDALEKSRAAIGGERPPAPVKRRLLF